MVMPRHNSLSAPAIRITRQTTLDAVSRPKAGMAKGDTGKEDSAGKKGKEKSGPSLAQGGARIVTASSMGRAEEESEETVRPVVSNADESRAYLEKESFLFPEDSANLESMAGVLAQISLLPGLQHTVSNTVRSVALMLGSMKVDSMGELVAKMVGEKVDALVEAAVKVADALSVTTEMAATEIRATNTAMAASAMQIAASATSYHDALASPPQRVGPPNPHGVGCAAVPPQSLLAPRVQAREGGKG